MASVGRSLLLVTRDGAQRNSRSARLEAIASSVKACGAATLRAVGRENRAASDCSAILAKYYQNPNGEFAARCGKLSDRGGI